MADHLNVNLKIIDAKNDILKDFDKVIYHLDEPQADPAPINVYNICKAARQDGIKVLIGGTAGDDIFSGYRRHQALRYESIIDNVPVFIRKVVKKIITNLDSQKPFLRRAKKLVSNFEKTREERYKEEWYNLIRKWNEEFNYNTKSRVYRNTIRK